MGRDSTASFTLSDTSIASIIEASPIGMLLVNTEGSIVYVNAKAQTIFGYTQARFLKLKIESIIPERLRHDHVAKRGAFTRQPSSRPMGLNRLLYGLTSDGKEIPVEVGLSPLNLEGQNLVLVSLIDVSERIRAAQLEESNRSLAIAASSDSLTGLLNRRSFELQFRNAIHNAMSRDGSIVLMYIDLDGFKQVNDNHGHEIGDKLLIEVAKVLTANIRAHDIVARIGGDEFAICLGAAEDVDQAGAGAVASKLIACIESITAVEGKPVSISASIGIVKTSAGDNVPLEALLRKADRLMYQAKNGGKGNWIFKDYGESN